MTSLPRLSAAIATTSAVLMVCAASPASARSPYLLPNGFAPDAQRVTLQGAFTDEVFFNGETALGAASYIEIQPSGAQINVPTSAKLRELEVVEAPLDGEGTYRFTTGLLPGRVTLFANIGGKWVLVRQARAPRPGQGGPGQGGGDGRPGRPQGGPDGPGAGDGAPGRAGRPQGRPEGGGDADDAPANSIAESDVPADAPKVRSASFAIAETYVTKGAPTDAPLKTTGSGLELKPGVHPNAIFLDQGLPFQLLADGEPAARATVTVYRADNKYDDRSFVAELKTDAKGAGKVTFSQPGVYVLVAQYPGGGRAVTDAPPARTYNYSLTFEVTR